MASWDLLDEKEENELHKARLLNVEEKPFKRVTKRLNTLHASVISRARQTVTPPPESNGQDDQDASNRTASTGESFLADVAQLKEDITLDFAAFDSSIARLQFLMTANEKERQRYATERERIIKTSQAVRDNTANLRIQLDQARATLEQRKKFDELADKITSNPSLRARSEQATNLAKLEEEIAELEAEAKNYGITWQERRDQFARIMEESMRLRRLIRDEKEEVERREGMGGDEGDGGDAEAGQTPRPGIASGSNTPRPESGLIPRGSVLASTENGDLAGTPRPLSTTGGQTPARESPAPGQDSQRMFLRPHRDASFARGDSQAPSREGSVDDRDGDKGKPEDVGDDVDMDDAKNQNEQGEEGEEEEEEPDSPLTPLPADDTPQIVVDDEDGPEDKMDTT